MKYYPTVKEHIVALVRVLLLLGISIAILLSFVK